MLMRYDPFRELDNMLQMLARHARTDNGAVMPIPMDAYRDGEHFVVAFDLPGVEPDSIEVTVDKNELTVRAERAWQAAQDQDVLIAERPKGRLQRQLFLGESLETDDLEASYDRGVLTLRIPISEHARPRKIPISSTVGSKAIDAG